MLRRALVSLPFAWSLIGAAAPAAANDVKKDRDCRVVGVKRSDHVIHFVTRYMPDPQFNDRHADLDGHRVQPRFAHNDCRAEHAIVFMHGGTTDAVTDFDLRFKDYSLMQAAALAGIDTFTFNSLGWGGSSRLGGPHDNEGQFNPCNASLPACDALLTTPPTCKPGLVGGLPAQCDCVLAVNADAQARYLTPNPLSARCDHSSPGVFLKLPHIVKFLDLAVDDARAKSGLDKVVLFGWSAGAVFVGNYLGNSNQATGAAGSLNNLGNSIKTLGDDGNPRSVTAEEIEAWLGTNLSRSAKVERAIVLGSPFGGASAEAPALSQVSHSLGIDIKGTPQEPGKPGVGTLGSFNLSPACPGQMDPEVGAAIWAQIRGRDPDPHGQSWGADPSDPAGGVMRYATHTRWYGIPTVQSITTPLLIIRGALDHVVAPARSQDVYNNLVKLSAAEKELLLFSCSSHVTPWEDCSGSGCVAPYRRLQEETIRWVNEGSR